jgi:transcription elongation factor GreA
MDAELQALVDAGKLQADVAVSLDQLNPGTFCLHKSWGFGQINSRNLLLNQVLIDFQSKKQHPMQLLYAAETLQALAPDHILVKRTLDPDGVKKLAKDNVPSMMELFFDSFGDTKVTLDQIQKTLCPEVIANTDFKKWWDTAKKTLRRDGRFSIPSKRTDPITMRDQSVSLTDELIQAFQQARQPKAQLVQLEQILKNLENFTAQQLSPVIKQVEESGSQNARMNPTQAIELLIVRNDLCQRFPDLQKDSTSIATLLKQHHAKLDDILAQVPAIKQKHVLSEFAQAFPENWDQKLYGLLPNASSRLTGEIAKSLVEAGKTDELRKVLHKSIKEHSVSSETSHWLTKERGNHPFDDLVGVELFTAIFSAMERDQFGERRRGSKIHDLLIDDRELVGDLLKEASLNHARDLMRRMMMTSSFEELNKRSLMARMIKLYPELQSMLTGQSEQRDEALIVSWASLTKRKEEYDDLIAKKIPENTKEISIARSYGDLRENFEFKAAKEMQTVLMRRKAELEQMLSQARGTNFENIDASSVAIGTKVALKDLATEKTDHYRILGAWDSDPNNHIISYQTAIAQALLGKRPGETAELPTESGSRQVEITSINPTNLELDVQ